MGIPALPRTMSCIIQTFSRFSILPEDASSIDAVRSKAKKVIRTALQQVIIVSPVNNRNHNELYHTLDIITAFPREERETIYSSGNMRISSGAERSILNATWPAA